MESERNANPDYLLKKQKEATMNLKQDHNKMSTDISVAKNRLADLDTRQQILHNSIQDILQDKRLIDKKNLELENKITGRDLTDDMQK